jgi:hypothetical protein
LYYNQRIFGHLLCISHIGIAVFIDQRFHGVARFISEVSFCWWGMNFCQYIDLPFVLSTYSPQIPSYLGQYITFFIFRFFGPKLVLSVVVDCTAVIYFSLTEIIK